MLARRQFIKALAVAPAGMVGEKIVLIGTVESEPEHGKHESYYVVYPKDTKKANEATQKLWGLDADGRKMQFTITEDGFSGKFV